MVETLYSGTINFLDDQQNILVPLCCIWHQTHCQNQLSQKLEFSWFQAPFVFFLLGGVGTHLHDFGGPGDRLEFRCFFMCSLKHPQDPGNPMGGR